MAYSASDMRCIGCGGFFSRKGLLSHLKDDGCVPVHSDQVTLLPTERECYKKKYDGVVNQLRYSHVSHTRRLISEKGYNKHEVTKVVKHFLDAVEKACGKENKAKVVIELYDYLVANSGFIRDEPNFRKTCRAKLEYFAKHDNFRLEWHYKRLFGDELPKYGDTQKVSTPTPVTQEVSTLTPVTQEVPTPTPVKQEVDTQSSEIERLKQRIGDHEKTIQDQQALFDQRSKEQRILLHARENTIKQLKGNLRWERHKNSLQRKKLLAIKGIVT